MTAKPTSLCYNHSHKMGGGVNLVVRAAIDTMTGRHVVTKRLPPKRARLSPLQGHLINEVEIMALLVNNTSISTTNVVLPIACYHLNGTLIAVYEKYTGDLTWLKDASGAFIHSQR